MKFQIDIPDTIKIESARGIIEVKASDFPAEAWTYWALFGQRQSTADSYAGVKKDTTFTTDAAVNVESMKRAEARLARLREGKVPSGSGPRIGGDPVVRKALTLVGSALKWSADEVKAKRKAIGANDATSPAFIQEVGMTLAIRKNGRKATAAQAKTFAEAIAKKAEDAIKRESIDDLL